MADDATKATMTAQFDEQLNVARKRIEDSDAMRNRILSTGTTRGVGGMPSNLSQGGGVRPQGGTTITTRPAPADFGARAAGGMAAPQIMGPPSNLAPIPASRGRPVGPRSTPTIPIGGPGYSNSYGEADALQEYIDQLLAGSA